MTLSRITNYVDGNILTGAQLNNEFDNILNNGPALVTESIPSASMVQGLTGSIISNIGSFAANAYQLKSTTTITTLSATSSFSVNTQTAGPIAGGRDQAAAFASTTVHFYAITTGGTSTSAVGTCSTKPPTQGPTLPTGYSAWAYLGSAAGYSTGSSAYINQSFLIAGSQVFVRSLLSSIVLSSGGASAETDVACGGIVPNIATNFTVSLYKVGGITPAAGGGLSIAHQLYAESGAAYHEFETVLPSTAVSNRIAYGNHHVSFPNVRTTPTFGYNHVITVGTSAHMSVAVVKYAVPNGDAG